jgi:hypothetical protein
MRIIQKFPQKPSLRPLRSLHGGAIHQNKSTSIFDRTFQIISILIFFSSFLSLAFLILVNQKGFDIEDEGFHLLASQFPMEVEIWPNVAHIYTGLMFNFVGKNIVALRILSELMLFTSASFFFLGMLRLVSVIYPAVTRSISFRMIAWSMMCLGSLFYYVHFDTTPSYNSLNATFLNAAVAFLCFSLASMSRSPAKPTLAKVHSFAAGILIGGLLLVKFPTAIALTLLFSFILLIWPQVRRTDRFLNISMLVLGTSTWILLHIAYLQTWASLSHTIYYGVTTFLSFGLHKPTHCFPHYALEIIKLIINALTCFWKIYLVLLLTIIVSYWRLKNKSSKIQGFYFIALFFLAGWNSIALNFYKGGTTNSISLMGIYTGWLLILLFSVTFTLIYQEKLVAYKNNIVSKRLLVLSILLFTLPFAGAVGTANIITLNLTQYMAAWFGLILLLLLSLSYAYNNRWIFLSGSLIISAFASSQIISAGFIAPYNLNTSIQYQTVATAIGVPSTYLKLDKATSEFFTQLYRIANNHGFKPGDDILAFSNMPGIVFALGGKSPVVPWYSTLPNANRINEWLIQQAPSARIKRAFILQNAGGIGSMPDLSKLGIRFPSDYIFCGQAIWPLTGEWVRLWKSKQHTG